MTQIKIKKAEKNDLVTIIGLHKQLSITTENDLSLDNASKIFNKICNYPCYTIYVAEKSDKIVGVFSLLIMDNLAHGGMPSGIIEDVIVDESERCTGIGKLMVSFAMRKCSEYNCYKMVLSSNLQRHRAHKFYEELGFKKHGYSYYVELPSHTDL